MSWPRRAVLVARVLVRRRIRRALARPKRSALLVGLFLLPVASLFAPESVGGGGFAVGADGTVSGDGATVRIAEILPPVFSAFWLFFFVVGAFTVDDRLDDVDGGDLLVLGGGVRATVLGVSLAEHARRLVLFGIWFVAGAVGVIVAGAKATSLPLGAVGFVLLLLSATTAGHAVGLFARRALLDRGLPVRTTGLVLAGGSYLAFVAFVVLPIDVDLPLRAVGTALPTAWFADWLLLEYPGATVSPARLLGSIVFGSTVVVAGFLAKERLAADVWVRDPGPDREAGGRTGLTVADAVRRLVRPVGGPAAAALAWQVFLRRLRRPVLLSIPVVGFLVVEHELRRGLPPEWYPLAVAAYAGVTLPAAVALNPLADEGVGLPLVLASGLGGRAFVTGYTAAATLLAWLGTAAAVSVVGVLFGVSASHAATALAAAPLITVATAPVAVAAGTVLPRNDAHETADSEGIGLPSKYAFAVYVVVVALVTAPIVVAAVFASGLALGGVSSLLLAAAAALVGTWIATRRIEAFVLD